MKFYLVLYPTSAAGHGVDLGRVASVSKPEFRPKVKSTRKFAKVLILLGKAAANMF